jgi:hypothetical protein
MDNVFAFTCEVVATQPSTDQKIEGLKDIFFRNYKGLTKGVY